MSRYQLALGFCCFAAFQSQSVFSKQIAQNTPVQLPRLDAQASKADMASLTLPDLERIASQNNPTILQARAAVQAATGRAKQAGLLPNPVVGFQSEEFAFRALSHKPEYFGFVEQTLPLGGKLAKSRSIYNREVAQAEIQAMAQVQRVSNTVRTLYYQLLGAQQTIRLETELAEIAHDATGTTSELFNVGQADKPDFLEALIEQEQVEHELQVARDNYSQTWRALAAVLGRMDMPETPLQGGLEASIPELDENQLYGRLIQESPQIKAVQAQIEKARAVLIRAKAEPVPDLFLRAGIGFSSEFLENNNRGQPLGKTGVEGNGQVGMTLPIFNRNPGGIAAAKADLAFDEAEAARLKLALRVQLGQKFRDYKNVADAVRRYKSVILPRAEEAYKLYQAKFQQMAASYPQALISKRTMVQVRQRYVNALVDLHNNVTQLEGFLLTGGLDAPRTEQNPNVDHVPMSGVRSGSEGSINDKDALDTAGLVEY